MNNARGMITVDFLFAIVLVMGMTSLLFVLTFTLSVSSIIQYVTYSAARTYMAGHLDESTQRANGFAKYQELMSNPVLRPLFSNDWYQINSEPNVGDHTEIIPGYRAAANMANPDEVEGRDLASGRQFYNQFWGVGTDFVARVLDFQIPFFGSTAPDGDGSGSGFKTYIGSYLGREPTSAECLEFVSARWTAIRALSGQYSGGTPAIGYYPIADDGC